MQIACSVGGSVAVRARRREGGSVATRACLTRTAVADGRRPLARRRGCRGGGGRGSCPGERGAHQQLAEEVGEARRGRQRPNSLARPATGGGETGTAAASPGLPRRFLARGGRGRRGAAKGWVRSGRGRFNRRLFDGGRELDHGQVARAEEEERELVRERG